MSAVIVRSVTVVVVIDGYEPWMVANWAFRSLAERATAWLDAPEDREELARAQALGGLHFELLDRDQGRRIAAALERAGDQLRVENLAAVHPRDREFAETLGELTLRLSDLTTAD